MIQIFVNPPNNNPKYITISIVTNETTGFELKQLLTDRIGGDPKQLRLIYGGRTIVDSDIVTNRGIGPESTVYALARMLNCQRCPEYDPIDRIQKVASMNFPVIDNSNIVEPEV